MHSSDIWPHISNELTNTIFILIIMWKLVTWIFLSLVRLEGRERGVCVGLWGFHRWISPWRDTDDLSLTQRLPPEVYDGIRTRNMTCCLDVVSRPCNYTRRLYFWSWIFIVQDGELQISKGGEGYRVLKYTECCIPLVNELTNVK